MTFLKKFANKINKKQLNIVQESNLFEQKKWEDVQDNTENEWPEVPQEQDVDCGYEGGDSSPFEELSGSTTTKETQEESSSVIVEQENPSAINWKDLFSILIFMFLFYILPVYLAIPFLFSFLFIFQNLFIRLRLSEYKFVVHELDPRGILFSQANINCYFRDGTHIEDTIEQLVNKSLDVDNLPKLEVCLIDNIWYSSDNRRLFCIKESIRRGADIQKIKVVVKRRCDLNIDDKFEGSKIVVDCNNFNRIYNVSPLSRMNTVVYAGRSLYFGDE